MGIEPISSKMAGRSLDTTIGLLLQEPMGKVKHPSFMTKTRKPLPQGLKTDVFLAEKSPNKNRIKCDGYTCGGEHLNCTSAMDP